MLCQPEFDHYSEDRTHIAAHESSYLILHGFCLSQEALVHSQLAHSACTSPNIIGL
jgi:hypothetical protein